MTNIIINAAYRATKWHEGQIRKYTNKPYITHPIRVAHAVIMSDIATEENVAIAYLHDVIEDCNVSHSDLKFYFGREVADGVDELTNDSKIVIPKASRAERKAYDLKRISMISREGKIIKMFDRIDNLGEYPLENSEATKFLKQVYLDESFSLYQVLKDADEALASVLLDKINQVSGQIGSINYECSDR